MHGVASIPSAHSDARRAVALFKFQVVSRHQHSVIDAIIVYLRYVTVGVKRVKD
jgi:hypothetical protein